MRLSAIGDVCHAVAMVQAIQRARPDIQITWVIGKIEFQLLQGLTNITFVIFDKKQGNQARKQLKKQLADTHFDALFMMQVALRANWVSRVINADIRIGFDKARSKELHSLFINHRIKSRMHSHVLDGFMGFAQAIGVSSDVQWRMPLGDEDKLFAQRCTAKFDRVIVICPAASKSERCWSVDNYAAVINHFASLGIGVLLCGSPARLDTLLGEKISALAGDNVTNLIGKTSLKQLLAVLQAASCVLAPDTGPAHMATTVGTAVVGLYAHSNPRRTGPYNDLFRVVSVYDQIIQEQTGKLWQQLAWGKRAKGDDLMGRIRVKSVIEKIQTALE
jgi:heptosyltransferase I